MSSKLQLAPESRRNVRELVVSVMKMKPSSLLRCCGLLLITWVMVGGEDPVLKNDPSWRLSRRCALPVLVE